MKTNITQLTREQAIQVAETGCWKNWTDEKIVMFQLYQECLCMDFSRFHEAMEHVLERPIWIHEFAYWDLLIAEYEEKREHPTFEQIMNLIPKDKKSMV